MTEYITKEQAWEVVKIVARHADAHSIVLADKALADMPAADVVKVTRCKDCVTFEKCMLYSDYRFPFFENDFCSYGWDGEEDGR